MRRMIAQGAWLAGVCIASFAGCSRSETTLVEGEAPAVEAAGTAGAVRLSLQAGGLEVSRVTAVLATADGETQTHDIDVSGDDGSVSIFFGELPEGGNYTIRLIAGECSGTATFSVEANQTTLVEVELSCPQQADAGPRGTGSVQVIGHLPADAGTAPGRACAHVADITASPSVQGGSEPSSVAVLLNPGVEVSAISWSAASTTGATGVLSGLEGAVDSQVFFDCTADGTAYVMAHVTAPGASGPCTQHARVAINCVNQGSAPEPRCGDGVVNQAAEECDGSVPASAPAGSSCSASCTLIAPEPRCGDGVVNQPSEQCDGGVPASAPAGSTCSGECQLIAATPPLGDCGRCAVDNCALQRADVDATAAEVEPILACVLGANWQAGGRAPAGSCANFDLLSCYCGGLTGQDCANTAPSALTGQCTAQMLAGTACMSSSCVAPIFLNPTNANGKAMQYVQCQQDFCYDVCFNL